MRSGSSATIVFFADLNSPPPVFGQVGGLITPYAVDCTHDVLGTLVRISSNSIGFGAKLESLLGAFPRAPIGVLASRRFVVVEDESDRFRLYLEHRLMCSDVGWHQALAHLLDALNALAVDGFRGFAAHAGVFAGARKGAIACLAPSGVGKSTLTAAALLAGFDYISDEALCVAFDGDRVVPYPKPLKLSLGSCRLLGMPCDDGCCEETNLSHADFGASLATESVELTHLVRLVRRSGGVTLREVPRTEGVAWLLERSFNHYKWPTESFELVTRLAARCHVWELRHENARQAALVMKQELTSV